MSFRASKTIRRQCHPEANAAPVGLPGLRSRLLSTSRTVGSLLILRFLWTNLHPGVATTGEFGSEDLPIGSAVCAEAVEEAPFRAHSSERDSDVAALHISQTEGAS